VTTTRSGHAAARRWPVLAVMCAGYFLVLLDVTIVNVALPRIGAGLDTGVDGLQWVVDGYALPLASLLLAGGTLGDLRGHKRLVLVGLGVFGAASAGCGLAGGIGALIAARAGQGVGAALLLPGTLAIISRAFPERGEQARAIGVWAGVGSVALPAGPLLGGALVQAFGWRAVFLLNVPIVAMAATAATAIVRETREPDARRPDWAGVLLGGSGLAAATYAVVRVGHRGPDPTVLAASALAVLALVGFVLVERAVRHPMLPPSLFRRPGFGTANAVAGAMNLGTLGLLFLLTLYLQTVQGRSALAAGVALLPLFCPLVVLAPLGGRLTARVGPRPATATGLLVAAVGVGLLARLTSGSPYLALLPALLAWGVGLGLLTPAVVAAAVAAVDAERAGLAAAVNNTARQAGGAVGIAAFGAVAGPAGEPARFVAGLHATGLATAALYALAAAVSVRLSRSGDGSSPPG
jgi:DHA2 family methylenomycin A resistance protein-like MFS transporter